MTELFLAHVYYHHQFAGILREESGGRTSFTYDESYLDRGSPPISHTLALTTAPYISQSGLHPFFDNLVAEGWMEQAQTHLLGKKQASRFELLMTFGKDCAGAVSVVDPTPKPLSQTLSSIDNPMEMAVMANRASLSGIQPKLALIGEETSEGKQKMRFRPAKTGELSHYIGKFPSPHHDDLVTNEYLTTLAFKALLPHDAVVDLWVGAVDGFSQPALIIKRFDRGPDNQRLHFEEFNQLLGHPSQAKYNGAYKDMADFIQATPGCLPTEVYKLYGRIIAGFLLGNTDMHLKNFAMLHTPSGLRLSPSYDQVASVLYDYKNIALKIGSTPNFSIGKLKPGNIIQLGKEFRLSSSVIEMTWKALEQNKNHAIQVISNATLGTTLFKNQLIKYLEKRWNGTFALIGQSLSKRR